MKRILVLTFYYPPDLCAGSFRAGALIEALAPLASQQNIAIDIITTEPNRYHNFSVETVVGKKYDNVTLTRIKIVTHQSGFFDQARAFADYFFQTLKITRHKKYNIVFSTSSRLFTAFLGARIAAKQKIPLILDMRDIFTDTMQSLLKFPLKMALPFFQWIEKYTIKKASLINLVSPGFASHFEKLKNSSCEMSRISNGIDECFYAIDFRHKKIRAKKRVLYAGNIGQGQGLENIIPVLAEQFFSQCEFVIVGGGGRLHALKKICEHLSNVVLLPPVDHEKLILHYQDADILFLHFNNVPAFEKVLPSKIFEYAYTAKPMVAGVFGYAAKFLKSEVTQSFVFEPGNVEQALTAMHGALAYSTDNKNHELMYQKFNRAGLMEQLSQEIINQLHTCN